MISEDQTVVVLFLFCLKSMIFFYGHYIYELRIYLYCKKAFELKTFSLRSFVCMKKVAFVFRKPQNSCNMQGKKINVLLALVFSYLC